MNKNNEKLNDVIDRISNLENKISLLESNGFEPFITVSLPGRIIRKIDKIVAYNSGYTTRDSFIAHVLNKYLKEQNLTKED